MCIRMLKTAEPAYTLPHWLVSELVSTASQKHRHDGKSSSLVTSKLLPWPDAAFLDLSTWTCLI